MLCSTNIPFHRGHVDAVDWLPCLVSIPGNIDPLNWSVVSCDPCHVTRVMFRVTADDNPACWVGN